MSIRKRGRKVSEQPSYVRDSFQGQLHPGVDVMKLGIYNTGQYYFLCECGQHMAFMTVEAVYRTGKPPSCKQCGVGVNVKASTHEKKAYAMLTSMKLKGIIVTECKVLGGRYGAADIWVPHLKTLIMIDGEHHSAGRMHTKHYKQQVAVDMRFTEAALAKGFNVLRVGDQDVEHLDQYMEQLLAITNQYQPHVALLGSQIAHALLNYRTTGKHSPHVCQPEV
jgi:very-short-patch-repair endonuclease